MKERNNGRLKQVLVVAAICMLIAAIGIVWRPSPPSWPQPAGGKDQAVSEPTLLLVVDCSASTAGIRETIDRCIPKLLGCMDVNVKVVIVRMTRNAVELVEYPQVPTLTQLRRDGVIDLLALQPEKGTRPLAALNLIGNYVKDHPSERVSAILFTDGENSYLTDGLMSGCKKLSKMSNFSRIGVFAVGIDNRSKWQGYLAPFGARAMVCGAESFERVGEFAQLVSESGR